MLAIGTCFTTEPEAQTACSSRMSIPYQPMTATGLLGLPEEMLLKIAAHLSTRNLYALAQTCKPARDTLLTRNGRVWARSLSRTCVLPRGTGSQLARSGLPSGWKWADICLGLRLIQPAAGGGEEFSQGTAVSCASSQYPQVMHMDGTTQRSLQVAFPHIPEGRYTVVVRMAAARALKRGYISFFVTFKSGKNSQASPSGSARPLPPPLLQRISEYGAVEQNSASYGSPSRGGSASGSQARAPRQDGALQQIPEGAVAQQGWENLRDAHVDVAAGAAVRGPPLPQPSLLGHLRSRLRGNYTTSWVLIDKPTIEHHIVAPTTAGRLAPLAPSKATSPAPPATRLRRARAANAGQEIAAALAGGGEDADGAGADGAPRRGAQEQVSAEATWGDVVVGEVTLRRSCAPRFVFAWLQVARHREVNAAGGLLVDFVQLRPLSF